MNDRLRLYFVPHTHWDREWYLPYQQFRLRFVKLMDKVLRLLGDSKRISSFLLDGQALIVKDYLEIRPEKREQIVEQVTAKRLFVGPWYSQPNVFMAGGEALIRNLLLGLRESGLLGGAMKISYLPDAFGLNSQLPQILAGFGIEDVVIWRGLPSGTKTAFRWEGADGTTSYGWYMYGGYGNARALVQSLDDHEETVDSTRQIRPGLLRQIDGVLERYRPRLVVPEVLMMNGIDHQFPQEDLETILEVLRSARSDLEPTQSSLPAYCEEVKSILAKDGISLDTIKGELRHHDEGLILPGSQSTRTAVKIANDRIETLLEKWVEPFATISFLAGYDYPRAEIWKAWEYVLQNHTHDSIACASTDHTFHQVMTRFEWAEEMAQELLCESLQKLCNAAPLPSDSNSLRLLVFNPLSWSRSEPITAELDIPQSLGIDHPAVFDDDAEIPVEVHRRTQTVTMRFNPGRGHPDWIPVDRYVVSFRVSEIPPVGFKALRLVGKPTRTWYTKQFASPANTMENEYLRVHIRSNGTLEIVDKRTGNEFPPMHFFEDTGEAGDGFRHVEPECDSSFTTLSSNAVISLVTDNTIKTEFHIAMDFSIPDALDSDRKRRSDSLVTCGITSRVTLWSAVPRVDVETEVRNRGRDHRLRVVFPSGIETTHSYAEQPFDVVNRPIALPDFNEYEYYDGGYRAGEKPSPTHPQLAFAGVSDGTHGLLIANRGLYEYEVKDNVTRDIALTLLRCTDVIHFGSFALCDDLRLPEMQCIGTHSFSYSIIPHQGTWEQAYRHAYEYKIPLRPVLEKTPEDALDSNGSVSSRAQPSIADSKFSLVSVDHDRIIVTAVKMHETRHSLIVRLLNLDEREHRTSLAFDSLAHTVTGVSMVSLREQAVSELEIQDGVTVAVSVGPKKLVTLELELDRG